MRFTLFFLALTSIFASSFVFAEYDQQCLDDCFSTGHECQYCNWQCYGTPRVDKRIYSESPCELPDKFKPDEE